MFKVGMPRLIDADNRERARHCFADSRGAYGSNPTQNKKPECVFFGRQSSQSGWVNVDLQKLEER